MTYKEAIKCTYESLAEDPDVVFIGYNVAKGSKGGGAFADIPENQLIEMPLAESLMMGVAVGMALDGYKPVVYFERMDFITNALDVIVNQLDKLKDISKGEYDPQIIIRCVVGNIESPLYTGLTHTQDLSRGLRHMVSFPVFQFNPYVNYDFNSRVIVETKDSYNEQV